MFPLILFVVGIVLEEQVGGLHTVGVIIAVIGGALFLIQMIVTALFAKKVASAHKSIRRDFDRWA